MAHTLDLAQLLGTGPSLKSDHDPTKVISSDPASILGNGIESFTDVLLQLPEMAIAAISAALTGIVDAGLDQLKAWVPGIAQVVDVVEAIIGSIGDLGDLSNWFGNLEAMLGLPDFSDLGFDPISVVLNFVTTMINPLGFFANLLSGVIPGLQIPGLDASKIISGVFDLTNLPSTVLNSITGVAGSLINSVLSGSIIPGLDASKIVSGIFDLTQLPSTVLNSITGVAGSLINSLLGASFIPGLDASKITTGIFDLTQLPSTVLNTITGVAGSLINSLLGASFIPGLDASKITSGTLAQSFVTDLTTDIAAVVSTGTGIIDGIVNNLTNLAGSLWPQAQADAALKAQAAATAATAAAIALLQGNNNQSNTGGINQFVDFSLLANSTNLPSTFTETYVSGSSNSWGVVSGAAADTVPQGFNTTGIAVGVYNVMTTVTDYMKIGGIWSGAPGISYNNPSPFFLPTPWSGPYIAEHHLYVRWKDVNNWVRVRFTAGDTVGNTPLCILECRVAGTITNFSTIGHAFQPNSAYFLNAGTAGGLNVFQVILGTTPILTYVDASNVAGSGAAYRSGAIGRQANGAQSAGVPAPPGPMTYFTLQDNNPTGTFLGKQARWYRSTLTGIAMGTTAAMLPNAFFNVPDYNVGGVFTMDMVSNNNRITVSEKGLYEIIFHDSMATGADVLGAIWKNGTIAKRGGRGGTEQLSVFNMSLDAGDYINIGAWGASGGTHAADAAGTVIYVEIRQVLGVQ